METICMSKKHKKAAKDGGFFAIPKAILNHPDFLVMSWSAQALLFHMGAFFNGFNNGDISIPHSTMKERGWCRGTLEKARQELLQKGWIIETRKGSRFFTCALYALSWKTLNECKGKLDINPNTYAPRILKN